MKLKLRRITTLLLVLVVQLVFAQKKTVSGNVSDNSGPLPGVVVLIKGTTQGTETDFDGNYSIDASKGQTIQFSYIGMKNSEQVIADAAKINVVLEQDTEALDEVVVTALGISKEKKAIGYAMTTVKGAEIAQAQRPNPMGALKGKVAGLDITTGNGPGATQNVMIRGASAFGNNQPLYIIDGVPITNQRNSGGNSLNSQVDFGTGINALNPDDIESMSVLKGAAATALYGSLAANGVIMITTKSGEKGKMKINYSGSYGISTINRLPERQTQFGQGWSGDRALDENGNWGAPYDGEDRVWGNVVDNSQQIKPYVYLENNVKDFYDYGENIKNSLSLSGGGDKTNYFLSLSQNNIDGIIPDARDTYERYTVSTRGSYKGEKVTVSSSVNISSEKTNTVPTGQGSSVLRSLYEISNDISIVDLKDYNNKFNNLDNYFTPYGVNPYYVLDNNSGEIQKYKIFGKFQLDYDITDDLKATYRFGGDIQTYISKLVDAKIQFSPGSYNDGSSAGAPGTYSQSRGLRVMTNHDFMLSFNKEINEDFSFSTILGLNIREDKNTTMSGSIQDIDIDQYYHLSNSSNDAIASESSFLRRIIGAYISADINYKDMLYVNLTGRNDSTSTLPVEDNSYFYGGVTTSFVISEFMKEKDIDTGIFDFAKLRFAFGSTGTSPAAYSVYDRYVGGYVVNPGYPNIDDLSFPINGQNSYTVSAQLGNSNLKPEITEEIELGFETRFLKNRFGLDLSYYVRTTNDLIAGLPLTDASGFTSTQANLGDIENRGLEIEFDVTPIRTKDFKWNAALNYTANENKVLRLNSEEVNLAGFGGLAIYAIEGEAIGQFKSAVAETVIIDGVESLVVDGNGRPQATTDEQYLGKNINEDFRMGLVNTFSYKNFSFTATLDYRHGGHMYSNTKDYMHWTGSSPESVYNDRNIFIVPNSVVDNGDGTYSENTTPVDPTALHTFYSNGIFKSDDFSVIDRSFLKLRDVTLAYNVGSDFCNKLNVDGISFSVTATNFLLWTPAENVYVDPEASTFGTNVAGRFGEFGTNPAESTYTFGINIKL